ncbi:MAG: ORF6N domain-containing protein [Polyangia bacterium]
MKFLHDSRFRVILDSELAALYGVTVSVFNQAVKRNMERFPADFAFQLTREEYESLRSQIVILKAGRGAPGPSSARIEITTSCSYRTEQDCSIGADATAQDGLDRMMADLLGTCRDSAVASGTQRPTQPAALSVWFDGDCPTSLMVYPADLADCVQAQLEAKSFACASGLLCGMSDMVGSCPC